ncbi:NEDD8-conjugating protein ubc12 [Coemansia guatemalensis]|uniref:NEDD8-conjugating enzyme UBC12 n=1 Tax=Coemansia guatemalensis TaxID=2761395 RepID=A0A9W8HQ62_9FUNG|nr:NEDD8-conjugating protein ubc12 [Coemansia guatemalensis]
MYKIWEKRKAEQKREQSRPAGSSPAERLLQKELSEMVELEDTKIIPSQSILKFNLLYRPTEGYYKGGEFEFTFDIDTSYPHEPPKVLCTNHIYHPNIDTAGNICLNVLREDWKPVLNIQAVIFGIRMLFQEPNPDDPLNKDAAKLMVSNPQEFARTVSSSMRGYRIGNVDYDNVMVGSKHGRAW